MDRFHRLLVFVPGSQPVESVVRTADRLARENNATVTLVDVVGADLGRRIVRNRETEARVEKEIIRAGERRLGRIAELFESVTPEIVVKTGVDFVEVIHQVYGGQHDLVLVGSHPRSSQSSRLDPTLTHLLRKCPVPVWVVDTSHGEGDVFVALGPEFDDDGKALNRTLLQIGSSLARRTGVGLQVAHVWTVVGEAFVTGRRMGLSRNEVDQLAHEARQAGKSLLQGALEDVPAAGDATIHLEKGSADQKLIEMVAREQPSVVVMGTLARRGIAGLIIGNTAEKVLLTIDASVMAVKPPWFVSPVPPPADEALLSPD